VGVSFVIYGLELYYGMRLLVRPASLGYVYTLAGLLVAVYGLGLTRAWQLLGARRFGFVGWLSLLRELDEPARAGAPDKKVPDR
jgi:hypothetical protein